MKRLKLKKKLKRAIQYRLSCAKRVPSDMFLKFHFFADSFLQIMIENPIAHPIKFCHNLLTSLTTIYLGFIIFSERTQAPLISF